MSSTMDCAESFGFVKRTVDPEPPLALCVRVQPVGTRTVTAAGGTATNPSLPLPELTAVATKGDAPSTCTVTVWLGVVGPDDPAEPDPDPVFAPVEPDDP